MLDSRTNTCKRECHETVAISWEACLGSALGCIMFCVTPCETRILCATLLPDVCFHRARFQSAPVSNRSQVTLEVSTISLYASQPDSNLPAAYHAQQLGGHRSTQGAWQTAGAGIQQAQCMPSMPSEHSTAQQLQQRQPWRWRKADSRQPASQVNALKSSPHEKLTEEGCRNTRPAQAARRGRIGGDN